VAVHLAARGAPPSLSNAPVAALAPGTRQILHAHAVSSAFSSAADVASA